jgi:hypothetical protein
MQSIENPGGLMIDISLRSWKANVDRIGKFFGGLSPEQLEQEIAPGRNRLIYLWGHIAAVNDGLFPLLGLGPRLYPEMEAMFITNPDRALIAIYSADELKEAWNHINEGLLTGFIGWSLADWLAKHTAVSAEEFGREPHRNRYAVVLARNTHMADHFGQAILAKPRVPKP